MTTAVQTQSEYRNLPLVSLTESATNPRRSFDQTALGELAESIKTQGILAPLVVRPVGQHFEIVAGARRYRAAQLAGLETAPVRIVELTDAQALETSIVENLQRRDVHPLDEEMCIRDRLTHGLSRMTGNCHVRFLGEGAAAMPFPYPTPHGWEAENAGKIGGCSGGRAEHLPQKL